MALKVTERKPRILVSLKEKYPDMRAEQVKQSIQEYLDLPVQGIKIKKVYTIDKKLKNEDLQSITSGPLVDPIIEEATIFDQLDPNYDWTIEISYKKGMTDNLGKTAQITIEDYLGAHFDDNESVQSTTQYLLKGNVTYVDIKLIAEELLANSLIEDIVIHKNDGSLENEEIFPVEVIHIDIDDDALFAISQQRQLALSLNEMKAIRQYFSDESVVNERTQCGLPAQPTDVELEAIAQTWSEHCKHKIFNATIHYTENGKKEIINSVFKTYIQKATEELTKKCDWLVSVFTDNAGIISLNDKYNICFKVETHNSPSALDPYGGALTGILGVNRDIMGAGNAARTFANTDVFCFAPPNYPYPIPKKLLHPKRIFEGVRKGVEHGGNKSGVPTVNGAIVYDDRFLGKPLVYCGTAGIMPRELNGKGTHIKEIVPGDRIIIAGGRTGKDGIHGATFSSEELHEESPTSAVQIGDPFTQKKLHDFLIEARDEILYRTLTDNGAGGFSSSVGELAELSGGCEVHLDQALLKTTDIKPWEILLSESQERMTLAVPPESFSQLKILADKHEVELCDIGTFTDSKNFHILYQGETVGLLSLDFLHDGLPKMELEAEWDQLQDQPADLLPIEDYGEEIKSILGRYNVCSKEAVIRQYDHEVQGGSVVKPLVGASSEGPGDAAVIRPIECFDGKEGVVISNGICPKFSDSDTYHMAASAIDEAIRNYVAVGGNPKHLAILDNFCWPDPVYEPMKNPDGKHKLAQLVRANKALYETAIGFGTPIISGKDSMKNDCRIGDTKISVPPTLLISAIGKIDDINKSVSSDLKCPGDYIYVLGTTRNELAGSEYALSNKLKGGSVPKVDVVTAKKLYASLYNAISLGLVVSCHDCSDGGLAVSLAEIAFGGGLGVSISLSSVPCESAYDDTVVLFSETNSRFVISVDPDLAEQFEEAMKGCVYGRVGEVREDTMFVVNGVEGSLIVSEDIRDLKKAWKLPLSEGETV